MRLLALAAALLGACGPPCEVLPRAPYEFVLVNREAESFFCWTQHHRIDLTDDASLAASFEVGCEVTVARSCGSTTLEVSCPVVGVALSCSFDGVVGDCANDLGPVSCSYDAWLDQVSP